jgi:hypothetical protein
LLLAQIAIAFTAIAAPPTLTMGVPSNDVASFVGGATFVRDIFDARLEGSLSLKLVELKPDDYFTNGKA